MVVFLQVTQTVAVSPACWLCQIMVLQYHVWHSLALWCRLWH